MLVALRAPGARGVARQIEQFPEDLQIGNRVDHDGQTCSVPSPEQVEWIDDRAYVSGDTQTCNLCSHQWSGPSRRACIHSQSLRGRRHPGTHRLFLP